MVSSQQPEVRNEVRKIEFKVVSDGTVVWDSVPPPSNSVIRRVAITKHGIPSLSVDLLTWEQILEARKLWEENQEQKLYQLPNGWSWEHTARGWVACMGIPRTSFEVYVHHSSVFLVTFVNQILDAAILIQVVNLVAKRNSLMG